MLFSPAAVVFFWPKNAGSTLDQRVRKETMTQAMGNTGILAFLCEHFSWSTRPANSLLDSYWLGATREEVLAVQGSPLKVAVADGLYNSGDEEWIYGGYSHLYFRDDKLVGYNNQSNALFIHCQVPYTGQAFSAGATVGELLAAQGTPSVVSTFTVSKPAGITRWGFTRRNSRGLFKSHDSDAAVILSPDGGTICKVDHNDGLLRYVHSIS